MQHNLAQLLLQPTKPNETLEIFVAPEELVQKSNLGQLFILVEVKSRERGLKEKIKQLIKLVTNDYYSSPVMAIESSLESTCQNLNLNLNEIFAQPEIWYQKVNILLGVTKDNVLTFSQIGHFVAYLIREKKIALISASSQPELLEHTFSQLTTGEVKANDVVIIANTAIFDFFSLEKIKEVTSKLKPAQATEQFKNLMNENIKVPHVLAMIIKYSPSLAEADERFSQTKKYLQELYGSQESMQQLENLEQRTGRTLAASLWPNLGKVKKILRWRPRRPIQAQTQEKKGLKLPEIRKKGRLKKDKILSSWQKIKSLTGGTASVLTKNKKVIISRSKVTLAVILSLVLVFSLSLIYLQLQKKVREKELYKHNILTQIAEKKSQAEAALIYQDNEKANQLLNQALELLNSYLPEVEKWQVEFENKKSEILKLRQKINHIYEVRPEVAVDLSNIGLTGLKKMIKNNNQLYLLVNDKHIYQVLPLKKSFTLFLEFDNLKDISTWDKDNFILLSQDNKFYGSKQTEKKALNILLGQGKEIDEFVVYAEKIYILDRSAPTIYKVSQPITTTPALTVWYQDNKDLIDQAKEMTIDGDVWLVSQNEILKFFKGKREVFELSQLDKNLGLDLEFYTELDWHEVYILDRQNSRLMVANKDGLVQRQFLSLVLGQAQNLIVNDEQTRAWLTSDVKVIEIELVGE